VTSVVVRHLGIDAVDLVALIDRSEHVDVEYCVVAGALTERPVTMADIPRWDPQGDGPFSVAHYIAVCAGLVRNGADLLGGFAGDEFLGMAIVDPCFEPRMAWLAFLHVSRPSRRTGAATALWEAAAQLGRASGAETMYVSATPTGSAVGFYLRQGCQLADPPHPDLWSKEPDDIHLVCPLY
jgi:GNAT superfamily N-acetyltransferase